MESMKTIKVKKKTYEKLNEFAGLLQMKLKRRVSLDDAIQYLLKLTEKGKISSLAGTWRMSDEEEEEILNSLKKLWSAWKI